jgi:hypothetical protein
MIFILQSYGDMVYFKNPKINKEDFIRPNLVIKQTNQNSYEILSEDMEDSKRIYKTKPVHQLKVLRKQQFKVIKVKTTQKLIEENHTHNIIIESQNLPNHKWTITNNDIDSMKLSKELKTFLQNRKSKSNL